MSAFVFNDHPIDDLIRRNLNMAGVFVRAAGNQRWSAGAEVAATNARQAYDHAQELLRTLGDEERWSWRRELTLVDSAIRSIEIVAELGGPAPVASPRGGAGK